MALFFTFLFISAVWVEYSEARSRGGGRSFSRSKPSVSRTPSRTTPRSNANTPRKSSSFMRGLGGGLLGGAIGSMLFGGVGHGMGMGGGGGVGGSGLGLFEILIIGGLIYFLYRKFKKKSKSNSNRSSFSAPDAGYASGGGYTDVSTSPSPPPDMASADSPMEDLDTVRSYDPGFEPEHFKEFVQDVFFKVQAAWTRRDISVMKQYLGAQLLGEYEQHFADLKAKGQENRLENIAVRKVDIVDMGEMNGEPFVIIQFRANLLDYTVDEASGNVLEGSSSEPVKFNERWAFSKSGSADWKLEGIQE
ncbi:MAG: Tim44 domain-containing protein [Deltaproteobacteria bacterium]|nr:Tim44 domain-containing protein [Deltaproteobacteria bacterium]